MRHCQRARRFAPEVSTSPAIGGASNWSSRFPSYASPDTVRPWAADSTAYQQSDGRELDPERLPFIVVPAASGIWNYRDHGIRGGSVVAVVYRDRVQYAVVGDTGPHDLIGEASYATADALGINPEPHGGGAASGVTYIVFKNSKVSPIESHGAAVKLGESLARNFVEGDR